MCVSCEGRARKAFFHSMQRTINSFERAIRKKGLTLILLIVKPRIGVKWFACKDTRPDAMYDLVVYDGKGKAMVLPDKTGCTDDDLRIEVLTGGTRINGVVPYRDTSLDLF